MNRINYQKLLEQRLGEIKLTGDKIRLLLHVCCAPCSSYCLEYLSSYFEMTAYYYNPNIYPEQEYHHRVDELKRFTKEAPFAKGVTVRDEAYLPDEFFEAVRGYEDEPEGSARCYRCYELRLRKTAEYARENGYDCFTTTLSISPVKNADWLNEIGKRLSEEYGVEYIYSDFKKKDGYKRSIELSGEYGLYRQNYCGCRFSYEEAIKRNSEG